MTPIKFKPYGVGSSDKTIIAEKILFWEQIDYNGNYGTRIYLDGGAEVSVGEWPIDVQAKIASIKKE